MQSQTRRNRLIILVFLGFLWLPIIGMTMKIGVSQANLENREFAAAPTFTQLTTDGLAAYATQFERYYNDHFGFRSWLVYANSWIKYVLFSTSASSRVIVGKEGWLFFTGDNVIEDYRNSALFTPQELEQWKTHLERKYQWLRQHSIEYLFVIAPNTHTIYGEYLPPHIRKVAATSRYDQLVEYITAHSNVPILDLRPALFQAKSIGQVYSKTGSHWNALGAAVAQYAIAEYLAGKFPAITPIQYQTRSFQYKARIGVSDLAQILHLENTLNERDPVLADPNLPQCQTEFVSEKTSERDPFYVECPEQAEMTALVFRDSFFTALIPYISRYFHRTLYAQMWLIPDVKTLETFVKKVKPHIVIEERVERNLRPVPDF